MSGRLRGLVALPITMGFVTAMTPLFCAVRLARGRRACAEGLAPWASSAILRLSGVELDVRFELPEEGRQIVYISNHSSSIDLFAVLALGLPGARFFMKRGAWVFPPGGVVAMCVGTFFTVPQVHTERRRELFARACAVLKRTGESVYLTPEGTRVTTGSVGHFNKGAFHLAAALGAPIQPLYFEIPRDENPGKSWVMPTTRVVVHALPEIDTSDWHPDRAREHADQVQATYRAFEAKLAQARATGERT